MPLNIQLIEVVVALCIGFALGYYYKKAIQEIDKKDATP
jgi:uncharacterized protein YneF (UPF0154 family)